MPLKKHFQVVRCVIHKVRSGHHVELTTPAQRANLEYKYVGSLQYSWKMRSVTISSCWMNDAAYSLLLGDDDWPDAEMRSAVVDCCRYCSDS